MTMNGSSEVTIKRSLIRGLLMVLTTSVLAVSAAQSNAAPSDPAVARFAAAFNDAVASAAAAGAEWPTDPIRVALAFLELRGAPNTTITRADVGLEDATQSVVTVVEDGFLDDSVAGLEQTVYLERVGGVWTVTGYQGLWHCRRPEGATVPVPGVCL